MFNLLRAMFAYFYAPPWLLLAASFLLVPEALGNGHDSNLPPVWITHVLISSFRKLVLPNATLSPYILRIGAADDFTDTQASREVHLWLGKQQDTFIQEAYGSSAVKLSSEFKRFDDTADDSFVDTDSWVPLWVRLWVLLWVSLWVSLWGDSLLLPGGRRLMAGRPTHVRNTCDKHTHKYEPHFTWQCLVSLIMPFTLIMKLLQKVSLTSQDGLMLETHLPSRGMALADAAKGHTEETSPG
jgi:hypothetical protein